MAEWVSAGAGNRVRRHAKGFAWTGFDQLLSAMSNLVVALALARSAGAEGLGIYTVAFAVYLMALAMLRALLSEPALTVPVDGGRLPDGTERQGTTTAIAFLLPVSFVVVAVGLLTGELEILVIGVVIPLVTLQDFFRYVFFRRARPELAAMIDGTWVVVSIIGWPLVTSHGSPSVALAVWGVGGAISVGIGFPLSKVRPAGLRSSLEWWWREIRPLGGFLALDTLLSTFLVQITTLGLAAVLGTAQLGTLRGAQIILGPLGLALTAFNVFALPRLSSNRARQTPRVALLLSGAAALLAVVSTVALWILSPLFVSLLYADQLEVPGILILAVGARMTVAALLTGPSLLLKARRRGAPIAVGRLIAGAVGVPVVLGVAASQGLVPAVWAGNLATLVNLSVLVLALRSNANASHDRQHAEPDLERS